MGYLDYAGLQYLWGKLKEKFAPKSHSHDDRYYTESEMDGKLNSKVNNNEAGANGLINKLSTADGIPNDATVFISQHNDGKTASYYRRPISTLWTYIKSKADSVYQSKGSYAASSHTHDDRYYTETEINGKLNGKAVNITLSKVDLNTVKTPGFYNAGGGNGCTNVPVSDAFGLIVTHNANGEYYTQIFFLVDKNTSYRRYCNGGTWSGWTQDKYTDTNTWRGIQNNLTSDSTSDSLSAAQGKVLKAFVDGKLGKNEKAVDSAKLGGFPLNDIKKYFNGVPSIRNDGVMEVGKYIDFHTTSDDTSDYAARITAEKTGLTISGTTKGTFSGSLSGNASTATSATTASKLSTSAGSAAQPVYFKDGKPVAGTYTLGDASSKMVRTLGAVGNTGWTNKTTDDKYVPTMSFMAYWNGAYSGTSSNLQYCDRGRFGTIVTKSIADFAPASGSNDYVRVYNSGTVSGTDNASINDLAKQHFAMAMVNNATDNPLGAKKWIHAINMAWNNGVNSSWVSQIALGVQDSYGMWFRTGQGAIAGRAWNRVYDSSYHPNADHASAADSATNATNATTATKLSSNAGSSVQPVYFSGGKPVAIGYTISSSVPANAKFTDTTYGVASSSSNGLMSSTDKTKLDDFSRVINIQKQIKLTTDWLDTGIAGNSLDTGTYVVQVSGFNSSYTQLYSEIYSGVMSWYSGTTNSGNSSEIFLHNAGLADNNNAIYLRTLRVAGSKTLKLQIACKVAATGTDTLTFKFRRLI